MAHHNVHAYASGSLSMLDDELDLEIRYSDTASELTYWSCFLLLRHDE